MVGNVSNNGVVFISGKLKVNGIEAVLTFPNVGEGANPDMNDSDGTILSGMFFAANGFPGLVVQTPTKGSLHNQDFGFRPLCENFSVFAGTDVNICNTYNTTLTATGYGGLLPYTFSWSHGLGNGASKLVTPISTTTYTVTITDADGRTSTDQVTVTVTPCTEICADGVDNDSDGLVDGADPDCAAVGQPTLPVTATQPAQAKFFKSSLSSTMGISNTQFTASSRLPLKAPSPSIPKAFSLIRPIIRPVGLTALNTKFAMRYLGVATMQPWCFQLVTICRQP